MSASPNDTSPRGLPSGLDLPVWKSLKLCYIFQVIGALVVQRQERKLAERVIQVRFLAGATDLLVKRLFTRNHLGKSRLHASGGTAVDDPTLGSLVDYLKDARKFACRACGS